MKPANPTQLPAIIAKSEIQIDLPIAHVFDYVSDMRNFSQWFPGVNTIEAVGAAERPINEGITEGLQQRYLEKVRIPGKGLVSVNLVVSEWQKPFLFQTQGDLEPLLPQMSIKLSDRDQGSTHLEWKMVSRNSRRSFRWLLLPIIQLIMQQRADQGMRNLKLELETSQLSSAS